MAASRLGASILKYVYNSSSPYDKNPGQLLFFRGFASTLFVKVLKGFNEGKNLDMGILWPVIHEGYDINCISFSTTADGLANSFSQFGKIVEAKVIMDKVRNRSKGYGFVTFAEEAEARNALTAMNGKLLDGRVIFVDDKQPPSHRRNPSRAAND